jgi:choline dehydrogenase-like flavoprotein
VRSNYEFIIVGSGAGGATLAKELARRGKRVLVVEKGKQQTRLGSFWNVRKIYDATTFNLLPAKSREGVIFYRTFHAGGTTIVSCGNGVRSLEKELSDLGIHLDAEFLEAELETRTATVSERLLSSGSKAIREAARSLGYKMDLMPKFIDSKKCRRCGACSLGCASGAKWTAVEFINEAVKNNAEFIYETQAEKIIVKNGKASGIVVSGPRGCQEIAAKCIILAAGALATPVLLQRTGINEAGAGLFLDLYTNNYGTARGIDLLHEPTMTLVNLDFHKSRGFLLSPYINAPRPIGFFEMGIRAALMPRKGLIGIMAKTTDDPVGVVYPDGSVSKPLTVNDRKRLKDGSAVAMEILIKAGADPKSIVVSRPLGAHPGGTASIGKVVDKHLQTKIDGLFVCDASVLPTSPGLPPILTIIALAKYLAKTLAT